MTRSPLLISALAIAALLAVAPVAASPAANPEPQSPYIEFDLAANHGLHAHVETNDGEVTLEIGRKGRSVSYEVPAEITEEGLKANFGRLGLIEVAFRPTKTLHTAKPPKQCEGEPSTEREGFFIGTIEFTGERDYVRIEAARAKGRMNVYRESEWRCPRRERPMRLQGARWLSVSSTRERSEAGKQPATLSAFSRRCRCYFAAYAEHDRRGRGPTYFFGGKVESREGMEIVRLTFTEPGASAFVFDHAAGTAKVHPPTPFSGDGTFKRRPHGRDLWRSTIQVPLLGADPISVRGRSFRVALVRDLPGD